MSDGLHQILQRVAATSALLAAIALGAPAFAQGGYPQGRRPGSEGRPPGAPPYGQGRPPGAPAAGMPVTSAQPGAPPRAALPSAASTTVPGRATPSGERFFIVASVDLQKSQLLLKYPTEVTVLMHVSDSTKLADDSGNPLKLSDFRAGDTVWVTSSNGKDGVTALRVRKGEMTVADLHRYYLDYPEIK